jgi:D-glycero-D-manno-heptose 1,7-bisphosphate phosphatase
VSPRRAAVFLDRDGVLNRRPPPHQYITSVEALQILPGVAGAVASLRRNGFVPMVVSNQRGVARGLVSREMLTDIERRLGEAGVEIEEFYYCTHDLDDACDCRKPRPGLLLRAAHDHSLDLQASVMIGDDESDMEAGRAAGCRTIRIGPYGTSTRADRLASDLPAAATIVSEWAAPPRPTA